MFFFIVIPDIKGANIELGVGLFDDAWDYVVAAMKRRPLCQRYLIKKLELHEGSPVLYRVAERMPSGEIAGFMPQIEKTNKVLAMSS